MKDPLNAPDCAEMLKSLGDPERLRIIQTLRAGPLSVGEVAEQVGSELQNVSHHLQVLKQSGLVTREKSGRHVIYSLSDLYRSRAGKHGLDVLDFGCCRLELGNR
jgi:ArsR family transcriptional regulator, nickel/cobalt-responsive transcriptional repressor